MYWRVSVSFLFVYATMGLSIVYFYSLRIAASPIFPFHTYAEEYRSVAAIALVTTLPVVAIANLARGIGIRHRKLWTALVVGLEVQVFLTCYAMFASAMSGWLITHTVFFGEYNWLTFILEVAPVTSACASVLRVVFGGHSLS